MVGVQWPGKQRRLGEQVKFRMVATDLVGTIIEDRGPLAGAGKHLYRVRYHYSDGEDRFIELTEDVFQREPVAA